MTMSFGGPLMANPRRRHSLASPTIYRGVARPAKKSRSNTTYKGIGRQGTVLCPACNIEVTTRLGRDDEPLKQIRRISSHLPGGGRVYMMRGDIPCKGTGQLVADPDADADTDDLDDD